MSIKTLRNFLLMGMAMVMPHTNNLYADTGYYCVSDGSCTSCTAWDNTCTYVDWACADGTEGHGQNCI